MSVSVTMPRLGESVSEGTVTRWLKKEGDQVAADEPLLEVSTDKVDTEIPSPAAGVLTSIKVAEDETVEVGSELAVIDDGASGGGGGGGGGGGSADDTAQAEGTEEAEDHAPAAEAKEGTGATAEPEPDAESTQDADQQQTGQERDSDDTAE